MNAPLETAMPRRRALSLAAWSGMSAFTSGCATRGRGRLGVSFFQADVTVPPGHGMMGGAWVSKSIADPLEARGIVLTGSGLPVVFVSVDWCEIRNDAYREWQEKLARAAGTRPERVMISTIHQHDAPVVDLAAEAMLRSRGLQGSICDPHFHQGAVRSVADALSRSIPSLQPLTHIGTGLSKVQGIASNRRYTMPDGSLRFDRTSATRNVFAMEAGEGLIDPWLRVLSFWNHDAPIAALSFYAVHPMSYYGQGEVSADFPGIARRQRQVASPGVFQIYASGCSGNVTAGKYNTGARENRAVLAGRLSEAMFEAWQKTRRTPVHTLRFRSVPVLFEPRLSDGFDRHELEATLSKGVAPFKQCLAAMGLSWLDRLQQGRPIEIPCLDLGAALLVLLPGESYVEFQLAAQQLRSDSFVCVAGYGDGATGYVPTEQHWREKDSNLSDWCWVAPGSSERLMTALGKSMRR